MTVAPKRAPLALAFAALLLALPESALPQEAPAAEREARDGQRDFDWEIGSWSTHLRYRPDPFAGTDEWIEYVGTSDVRAILGGRSNLVELSVEGPAGRIEGMSLRLYDPQARQWTLNFANIRNGQLTSPVAGGFDGEGVGTFYGVDTLDGRTVLVRFVISDVTLDSARFVQSLSADGGTTWKPNWIAVDTRR